MQTQANAGEILLYEGQHGVDYTNDIGRLVKSEITPTGEWITTYRLYDENDGFEQGSQTLEKADKLWRQVNGLPPYEKPMQKGFSIEGYIPDGGILQMSDTGQRVIDSVDLDGVIVTPRPSYKDSAMTAIYKALDELLPERRVRISENIRGKFINRINDEELKNSYYSKRYKLDDALNETIEEIMSHNTQVRDRLNLLFDEYKVMMIELIAEHQGVFVRPPDMQDVPDTGGEVDIAKMQRMNVLKNISGQLQGLIDMRKTVTKSNKETKHGRHGNKRIKSRRKTNYRKHN